MKHPNFLLLPLLLLLAGCHHSDSNQVLTIKGNKKNKSSIRISSLHAKVNITGRIAETTLEITFRNTSSRVMEAMLDLPLPEGASISRYALEVNGRMREGVIVDKQLGRVAFDNTIRQNIDPGLLEKTKGNRFRTRIYPVPVKGTKRVLLSYTEPLREATNKNGALHYSLPISNSKSLRQFQFDLTYDPRHCIVTPSQSVSKGRITIRQYNSRPKALNFLISPTSNNPDILIQKGRDGRRYFHLTDRIPAAPLAARTAPKKILLVWDTSHSASGRDMKRELDLLDSYFVARAEMQVDLHILRDELLDGGQFAVKGGNWQSLRTTLTHLQADGATRLDRLKFPQGKYGAIFYFGDGLSTLGKVPSSWGRTPIFTVNSSTAANHLLMSHMAETTGGIYVNLNHLSQHEALKNLTHQPLTLIKATGSGVSNVYIHSNGSLATVSGRTASSYATIKLHYGVNGSVKSVKSVPLNEASRGSRGHTAARLWAQEKVNELSMEGKRNHAQIVALAQTHRLVTEYTSLIVLDRIDDYVRYRIVPPEADMLKDYYARIKDSEAHDGKASADMAEVYSEWKELVKWHQTRFPRPESKRSSDDFDGSPEPVVPPSPPMVEMPMGPMDPEVSNVATAGLRSGDFAITRNSISSLLNNPQRTGQKSRSSITIKGWQPDTPYIKALKQAQETSKPLMPVYYQWKEKFRQSSGFYLDVADFFISQKQPKFARRILSNLAELNPESPEMLRILAYRYAQLGEYVLAESLFRDIAKMRAEEPQSHRDLALLLIRKKQYREAANLLWKVVSREWDGRFDGIQMIALNEWNQLVHNHGSSIRIRASQEKFRYLLNADVRVVISWDTDNSDMDLWVTDPKREKCYYSNTRTKLGGRISDDMTGGRGPEEFIIRRAPAGKYKIEANYYGTREQTLIGPTTLHATVITNWGKPNEKQKHLTFRLGKEKEVILIGEVEFER